jgi:predicted amidohydrolase
MKVAAYQAPLLPAGSMEAVARIRERVKWCETEGVEILCCPEAVLGGLADYVTCPTDFAIDADSGQLEASLTPLASEAVTTIVGFTEISGTGQLYNSAAVFHKGAVAGVYRKLHPAIRKSIYQAGDKYPVFSAGSLTFGIAICNDSNYPEPARLMASLGATALFVPTNNALPAEKADVIGDTRNADISLAQDNRVWVIRADVAGRTADLVSYGSSSIVDPDGRVLRSAQRLAEDLLVADLDATRVHGKAGGIRRSHDGLTSR